MAAFAVLSAWTLSACNPPEVQSNDEGEQQAVEIEYCASVMSYPGGVSLNGVAEFQYRAVEGTYHRLYGNPVTDGIAHAEVVVQNAAGSAVQCGETDDNGNIALTLPAGAGTYKLLVRSRAYNASLKASIFADHSTNTLYSISKTFSVGAADSSVNIGTLTAFARMTESASIEGGAFNILKQIFRANKYIRTQIGDSSFVAPKVAVYWRAGFNPYTYFGGTSLLSFYRPGTGQLFILGGDGGDVRYSDTDHFDNSVILHEYAHFLEDSYAHSESPGGSHNGNFIIDPRLAWSEGWANFFQAAVLKSYDSNWNYYVDTVGFAGDSMEGGSGYGAIKVDMTMSGATGKCSSDLGSPTCDPVSLSGEGTFREMSISRYLFKTIQAVLDGGAGIPFSGIWTAFSGVDYNNAPIGLGSSKVAFKNVALFNQFLYDIINANYGSNMTAWDAVRSNEKQNANVHDYADTMNRITENTCPTISMSPSQDATYGMSGDVRSNLLTANDFYILNHSGTDKTITLEYTGGSTYLDLDLMIYRQDYIYQESDDTSNGTIIAKSARPWATENGREAVTLTGLAAGKYLINVKAYTYGRSNAQLSGSVSYRLKVTQSGTTEDLCPAH